MTVTVTVMNAGGVWFYKRQARSAPCYGASTHQRHRTIKRARRQARGIIDRWPTAEVHIHRYDNGRMTEEIWRKSK